MKWFLAMLRESRGARGRLFFFTLCVAVGVAAIVGVAALAGTLRDTVTAQSRDLLAADLMVESRRPLPPELHTRLQTAGALETTTARDFATMVTPLGADQAKHSRLARLKAVKGAYPFYGKLVLDPPGLLQAALENGAVVGPEFGLRPGDKIRVGRKELPVSAIVLQEPQRLSFMSMFGPRVFVAESALKDSGLLGFGSRMRHQLYARYDNPDLVALATTLRRDLPGAEHMQIETWREGQPRVQRTIERVERYLGLVALLSLILGGIGVAQIARTWIESRTPAIATLRCIGMRPPEVLRLFLGQIFFLAVCGSALGAIGGSLLPYAFLQLAGDFIPPEVLSSDALGDAFLQPLAVLRGMGIGIGIAMLFSLPPLTAVWRVSPALVLRADASPLPTPRIVSILAIVLAIGGIYVTAAIQSESFKIAMWFTILFLTVAAVLTLSSRLLIRLVGKIPRGRLHPYFAQGLAALGRPGAGTTGGLVALGLGIHIVTAMVIVEGQLSGGIQSLIPKDAPTVFLVDIQPDQWKGVESALASHDAHKVDNSAIVMGRLRAINGRDVSAIARERGGRANWTLTREQRMAPMAKLPEGNVLVEGTLWSDPVMAEVSLEKRYADRMGVKVGDTLTFDVQGLPQDFKLTSLRDVDWRTFSLNFFVAVEPGSMDGATGFLLASAKVGADAEQPLQDALAQGFPNVTMIKVRNVLEQIGSLLQQLSLGVRLLGIFTVIAGLLVLAGAVSATMLRRQREAALLKTLGATRRGVITLLATEYGLLGALAGFLGAAGSLLLAWAFLTGVADLSFEWPIWIVPIATVSAALGTILCGILASSKALRAPPREVLQG